MRSVDRLRAWELRRHHPSVGYRPRIPRAAARPAARISLAQVAQAGALSAPRIEVLGEAAVDHRPGIQVSVWALAAGADIEKHLATTLMPALGSVRAVAVGVFVGRRALQRRQRQLAVHRAIGR